MPTPPTPIEAGPPVPTSAAPEETFDAAYEAFNTWERDELQPGANALATNVFGNAVETVDARDAALQASLLAVESAASAAGAANFKGLWPDLAGPLSRPACVKHEGRFWLLLDDLPDVAASEPGVSADWTSLDAGQVAQTITANTTAVPGVYYVATTAGITLTIPSGWLNGDYVAGRNASGGACYIDWGTNTLLDEAPESPMRWPSRGGFEATNNGSTFA